MCSGDGADLAIGCGMSSGESARVHVMEWNATTSVACSIYPGRDLLHHVMWLCGKGGLLAIINYGLILLKSGLETNYASKACMVIATTCIPSFIASLGMRVLDILSLCSMVVEPIEYLSAAGHNMIVQLDVRCIYKDSRYSNLPVWPCEFPVLSISVPRCLNRVRLRRITTTVTATMTESMKRGTTIKL